MIDEIESEFFDLGDKTALVCVDHLQYQKLIVTQLTDLGYKVHLGLFEEDILLKLTTYSYTVVVIYENFKGATADQNPILDEMVKRPGSLRGEHYVILLGHHCATNDAITAFSRSVDQIINISDLANFKPIVRRGLAQHEEVYQPFRDIIRSVQIS